MNKLQWWKDLIIHFSEWKTYKSHTNKQCFFSIYHNKWRWHNNVNLKSWQRSFGILCITNNARCEKFLIYSNLDRNENEILPLIYRKEYSHHIFLYLFCILTILLHLSKSLIVQLLISILWTISILITTALKQSPLLFEGKKLLFDS